MFEKKLTLMEDNLKILKFEYLGKDTPDFPQMSNLSLGDQTKIRNAWKKYDHQWKKISKY